MLLDKSGKLVKSLDFRGTKVEYLDKLTAKELFMIMTSAQQAVNLRERFKAKELAPLDWDKTIYQPIRNVCPDKKEADKLFGVVIKQALIMTPLLFRQVETSGWEQDGVTYVRESLEF
ncbi:MAG: hypothetical protein LBE47_00400 [Methanomassiliicoccaceae archaeon]|jgi:hypothetical protein|nr:hypothetical protein [Methanomassiliicoccaceae archaeon]